MTYQSKIVFVYVPGEFVINMALTTNIVIINSMTIIMISYGRQTGTSDSQTKDRITIAL